MSTFFGKPTPPKAEDHPANRASSEGKTKEQNSNSTNEPGNTLTENPSTAPGVNDSNKEAAGQGASEAVRNEDSNKESVCNAKKSPENAQEGEQSGSDESDAEKKEDNIEYPSGWRLLFITIALCLCVFCTALVRCLWQFALQVAVAHTILRITRSSQRRFPRLLISSTLSLMWVGMVVRTC